MGIIFSKSKSVQKKMLGNTRETTGKHPGNTQEMPGKHQGKGAGGMVGGKVASLANAVGILTKVKER